MLLFFYDFALVVVGNLHQGEFILWSLVMNGHVQIAAVVFPSIYILRERRTVNIWDKFIDGNKLVNILSQCWTDGTCGKYMPFCRLLLGIIECKFIECSYFK